MRIGIFALVLAFVLAGCSSLPAALGGSSTVSTATNPTGSTFAANPVNPTKTVFLLPDYYTVNSNCANNDANSCTYEAATLKLCTETKDDLTALPECTSKHWLSH